MIRYWLPLLIYMGLIVYLSSLSQPPETLMEVIDWGPIDKVFHLVEFTVLGVLLARALSYSLRRTLSTYSWIIAFAVAVLFGVSDEWHQSFVIGRHSTVSDLIVDIIGSALGVGIVYLRVKRKETQDSE